MQTRSQSKLGSVAPKEATTPIPPPPPPPTTRGKRMPRVAANRASPQAAGSAEQPAAPKAEPEPQSLAAPVAPSAPAATAGPATTAAILLCLEIACLLFAATMALLALPRFGNVLLLYLFFLLPAWVRAYTPLELYQSLQGLEVPLIKGGYGAAHVAVPSNTAIDAGAAVFFVGLFLLVLLFVASRFALLGFRAARYVARRWGWHVRVYGLVWALLTGLGTWCWMYAPWRV